MNATQPDMAPSATPQLHILQSLWGMDRVRSDGVEWTLAERLAMIDEAGFDGISAHVYPTARIEDWIGDAKDRGMVIEEIRLLEKAGGKSGHWKSDGRK